MTNKAFTSALLVAFAVAHGASAEEAGEKAPAHADGKDGPKALSSETHRTLPVRGREEEKEAPKPEPSGAPAGSVATPAASAASNADDPDKDIEAALDVARRALKGAKGEIREAHGAAVDAYKKAHEALVEANRARRDAMKSLASLKSPEEREKKLAEIRVEAEAARKAALGRIEEVRKTLRAAATERMTAEERTELRKKLDDGAEKRRADRRAAAAAEREQLEKRFGKKLEDEDLKRDVRVHAWRLARLRHLVTLAELRNKPELKAKAEALIQKEIERFEALGDDTSRTEKEPGVAKVKKAKEESR